MPDSYPNSITTGSPPQPGETPARGERARSDAGQGDGVAAEHPKGAVAPLPPGHPSRGTIDEAGEHG
jgi:hypothetical protein